MDLKSEFARFVPPVARPLLGLPEAGCGDPRTMDQSILFTDIEGYTSITDDLGDDGAFEVVRLLSA